MNDDLLAAFLGLGFEDLIRSPPGIILNSSKLGLVDLDGDAGKSHVVFRVLNFHNKNRPVLIQHMNLRQANLLCV